MINAEKFKKEINKLNNDFGLADNVVDCETLGCRNCRFSNFNNSNDGIIFCSTRKVKWLLSEYKKPIILTELEYNILKFLADKTSNMYISRTKQENIFLHKSKPKKDKVNEMWIGEYPTSLIQFNKLFKFITWEDEEPYSINDILKNCRLIDDNIVIHKIVDE